MDCEIYVIDDDPTILKQISSFFSKQAISVHCFDNSPDFVKALKTFDTGACLIITDILMADIDGLELLQVIRKKHKNVPIVSISSDELYSGFSHELGANVALVKPLDLELLAKTVTQLCADFKASLK